MGRFQQERGQPHSVHSCLRFQLRLETINVLMLWCDFLRQLLARKEKAPVQNQGLAESITSNVQRGKAIEDTGKRVMCHKRTGKQWAGGMGQDKQRRVI